MNEEIEIWGKRLEIIKHKTGFMACDRELSFFMHSDKLIINQKWLSMFNNDNTYIGSIWISTDTDMKTIKKFLEETK